MSGQTTFYLVVVSVQAFSPLRTSPKGRGEKDCIRFPTDTVPVSHSISVNVSMRYRPQKRAVGRSSFDCFMPQEVKSSCLHSCTRIQRMTQHILRKFSFQCQYDLLIDSSPFLDVYEGLYYPCIWERKVFGTIYVYIDPCVQAACGEGGITTSDISYLGAQILFLLQNQTACDGPDVLGEWNRHFDC